MSQHNLTNREYFIDRASRAQERAAEAHYFACERLAEGKPENAVSWQMEQARLADWAAADVIRLIHAPAEWLDLKVSDRPRGAR